MKFSLLYPDPPWFYANWTAKKNGAQAAHYPGAKLEEMLTWDIASLAEKDALMFMWCTFPKIDEGLALLEAWGFKYVGTPFVWVKTTVDGLKLKKGPGFWTMSGAELVLLGRRGKGVKRFPETRGHVAQVVTAPVVKPHSRKPIIVRDEIVRLVGDDVSRLELFARPHEPHCELPHNNGWHATGREYDGRLITSAIEYYKELP